MLNECGEFRQHLQFCSSVSTREMRFHLSLVSVDVLCIKSHVIVPFVLNDEWFVSSRPLACPISTLSLRWFRKGMVIFDLFLCLTLHAYTGQCQNFIDPCTGVTKVQRFNQLAIVFAITLADRVSYRLNFNTCEHLHSL